ncbi:MAG: inositol 2-dehydrogenase [bacterium]|nr:inositol 2-dehydrogenase [bacterium]
MKKTTVGIIGVGRIGKLHTESITGNIPDVRVKTVADKFMNDDTKAWALSKGINNTSSDYRDILDDPEIDAVLICSSTDTHAQFIKEAAQAGKHIFCEKPVDSDINRIKETLKIVEEAGVKFQIGFNRRFDHNFKAIKKAVTDGKIGEPHIIKITSRDPEPPNPAYIHLSGGMFMDMTIHDFDMARFLSGSEVEEIFVQGAVLVDPEIGKQGDIDTAIISMKFANGAIGSIDNSRKAVYGYDQRAEVFGSKGSVHSKNDTLSTAVISTEEGIVEEKPLFFFLERYMDSFVQEMKEFFIAIDTDGDVPVGAVDAIRPVQIAEAAMESMKTGLPVKIQY